MWFKSECNRISERLWDYSAQKLTAAETAQIEVHLRQCAHCQAEAEAYRTTFGMLAATQRLPVPASQTSWQDLRPRLAPARRPGLRSADLLPRLTLAGAGSVMAAALLVVFFTSGHRSLQIGDPADRTHRTSPTELSSSATPSQSGTHSARSAATMEGQTDAGSARTFGSFFPGSSAAGSFAFVPTSGTVDTQAVRSAPSSTPKISPRLRVHPLVARRMPSREQGHSGLSAADYAAQLDGGNITPRTPPQNYVLNPVAVSAEEEPTHRYVISSIPVGQSGAVASNDSTEEGRAW